MHAHLQSCTCFHLIVAASPYRNLLSGTAYSAEPYIQYQRVISTTTNHVLCLSNRLVHANWLSVIFLHHMPLALQELLFPVGLSQQAPQQHRSFLALTSTQLESVSSLQNKWCLHRQVPISPRDNPKKTVGWLKSVLLQFPYLLSQHCLWCCCFLEIQV